MKMKKVKSSILSLILFIVGILLMYTGFFYGEEIAIVLSRPLNETEWFTSQNMMNGCTYILAFLGSLSVLLSIVIVCYLLKNWISEKNLS